MPVETVNLQIYKLLSVVVCYFSTKQPFVDIPLVGEWFRFWGAFTLGFDKWNIIRKLFLGTYIRICQVFTLAHVNCLTERKPWPLSVTSKGQR